MKQIIVKQKLEELNQEAEECIADAITQLLEKQPHVVLGLCGGRSVGAIYQLLTKNTNVDWKKVHIFLVDERIVPITDDESNFKLVKENLVDALVKNGKMPAENAHAFMMDESKPNFGAFDYMKQLMPLGGKFDVIVLSAGEDGHVAALYPEHRVTRNEAVLFTSVTDSPKPPAKRLTATKPMLQQAKVAILLMVGEAKRGALDSFRNEKKDDAQCPAKLVLRCPNWFLFTNLTV